ncbi:DUF4058 family protein [Dolichospermum sp. ST_con]|nr:DUF4058 family protein [Dolichospermum sp. ST_con]MDD1421546.1 DUF4058 family protein [Dolichospermum sp. ST_sed1]MDD1426502.1 DUF4058 family protein [Dolichospermum sp. ST_sed9]MDD1469238.1 DUF4058 family protein [Dolichospermum sp. ST_sed5]
MQNPFPGMNPYLKQPELWHQVHNRLIVAIADDLTPQIAPEYRVSIEEKVYTSVDDIFLLGIADVAIAKRNDNAETGTTLTTTKLAEPSKVKVLWCGLRGCLKNGFNCMINSLIIKMN